MVPVIAPEEFPEDLALMPEIGRGSFGTVKRGTYQGRAVAVKMSNARVQSEDTQLFVNELKLLKWLLALRGTCEEASRVVALLGIVLNPLCLVLEHMPNGDLATYLRRQTPSDQWKILAALDIASGLAFLHRNKIVHQDLKPGNVLLDGDFRCVLCDFGLSDGALCDLTSSARQQGVEQGTLQYMAPESLGVEPEYTCASDVYSLAMVLWELLYQKVPYAKAKPDVIRTAVRAGERLPLPDCSPKPLADLVPRCWAHDPAARLTADQVVAYLREHARCFRESRFKALYDITATERCRSSAEVKEKVLQLLQGRSRVYGVMPQEILDFVDRVHGQIESKVSTRGWPDSAEDFAAYWWTTDNELANGHSFCRWLNDALRADEDGATGRVLAIFARTLNRLLVQRGPAQGDRWPKDEGGQPVFRAFRGCGIPKAQWPFFAVGSRYRIPFYLASSQHESKAQEFAVRADFDRVIFEFRFSPAGSEGLPCVHVALLDKSMVPGEFEFLFVPYSVFEVLDTSVCGCPVLGEHLRVTLKAERDNLSLSSEGLPLADWH